jgi:hypothetical protein
MTSIYRMVPVEHVPAYLAAGWMVLLPSRPHPVGDAYARVPMIWICQCPPVEIQALKRE